MKLLITIAFTIILQNATAQIKNIGFNHISISTGISMYSDNSDFEKSLSDNGSYIIPKLGYVVGVSIPVYYIVDEHAVTFDMFYDYRGGNSNISVNTFVICLGFDGSIIKKEKYRLNMHGGAGQMFNYFSLGYVENSGNSSIDSSIINNPSGSNFKQTFEKMYYLGFKNFYIINEKFSLFQSFDFRFYMSEDEYTSNGRKIILPTYELNKFSFTFGLRYRFYKD